MSESLYCRTCARIHRASNLPKGLVATLLSRIITLTGIIVLIGMLPWLSGQDPAMALLRARSAEQEATPEALAAIRRSLGLDQGSAVSCRVMPVTPGYQGVRCCLA